MRQVLLLALLLAQVLPVAGQCYTGGSVAVPVTTYGKAWGCSGISAGSIFEGRIVSYNGDSFATILFTEANFIAWKASQKSSCLNPNCTATIKGSPWSFWYRFPVSGTYFIVVVCQNMLVDCNLDIDLSWGEKKPALQWNDWLILFGGLCVTVMLVFLFVICVRACLQGCAKQKDKADQEMQALSQEEDVLEAAAASAPEEAI